MNTLEKLAPSQIHLRWAIRRDMDEVLDIDSSCFGAVSWGEEDWIRVLRIRENIGMVAEVNESVVGAMAYGLSSSKLRILRFAVHPDFQRRGVGTAMIGKLVSKLRQERRNRIMLEVRETNLPAQLFLKSLGFRAVTVLRDFYAESSEDAYLMQYRYKCR